MTLLLARMVLTPVLVLPVCLLAWAKGVEKTRHPRPELDAVSRDSYWLPKGSRTKEQLDNIASKIRIIQEETGARFPTPKDTSSRHKIGTTFEISRAGKSYRIGTKTESNGPQVERKTTDRLTSDSQYVLTTYSPSTSVFNEFINQWTKDEASSPRSQKELSFPNFYENEPVTILEEHLGVIDHILDQRASERVRKLVDPIMRKIRDLRAKAGEKKLTRNQTRSSDNGVSLETDGWRLETEHHVDDWEREYAMQKLFPPIKYVANDDGYRWQWISLEEAAYYHKFFEENPPVFPLLTIRLTDPRGHVKEIVTNTDHQWNDQTKELEPFGRLELKESYGRDKILEVSSRSIFQPHGIEVNTSRSSQKWVKIPPPLAPPPEPEFAAKTLPDKKPSKGLFQMILNKIR